MNTPVRLDLAAIHLDAGKHSRPDEGHCLLEVASMLAGQPFSDSPPCVSPVLRTFGVKLNDVLPDDVRQQLLPLAPRLLNTAGDGRDPVRSWLALDWLVRSYAPAWLTLAGQHAPAAGLRLLARIDTPARLQDAKPALSAAKAAGDAARAAAWAAAGAAARDAAGDAAGDAAWAAAGAAARDAARAAVRDAARAAAGDAAWAAARDAAGAAAGDAARAAAWDAAGDAARAAARDAARAAAGDAAGDAARAALAPTVAALQADAIDLFAAMI